MAAPDVDISQLSESQQLALQQYTAVTDQDTAAAVQLLGRSQWNVQIAIAKFFDGEAPDPVAEALAAQNARPIGHTRQENLQESLFNHRSPSSSSTHDLAPRIVPQPEQTPYRPSFLLGLILTPFHILYQIFGGALGLFSRLFPFLTRPNVRRRTNLDRRPLKPRDAVARLKREFEEEYGANNIPFFEAGYAQALDKAKTELKFLLVLLISPEHDDTSSFIRDSLLSQRIQDYLNNPGQIILWVGDVRDSEAYEVSSALNCTKFPFTGVVAHDPKRSSTSMVVLERITGPMDAQTYLGRLTKAINGHEPNLVEARASRSAQDFSRNIREAQDSAYERSLAADREKARLKKEAEAEAAAAAKREKEATEVAERLAENKSKWRRWRASQISAEPGAQEKDVVRIALKMPEAARITRRFRATDGIEELYAFVDCYDLVKDGVYEEKAEKPDKYDHQYDFQLVQTLPRVVYGVEEGGGIGERVGKSGNLIVESIVAEEDEDDE